MADARLLHRLILVFIFVGIAFSLYAGWEAGAHYYQSCSPNSVVSCAKVDTSQYSNFTVLGVTVYDWQLGLAGFIILLAIDIPFFWTYDARYLPPLIGFALIGLGIAVTFGAIETFLIGAFCPVCLGAYISDIGVLTGALLLWRMHRAQETERLQRQAAAPG
jgi:uncharacterized membrane protein